MCTPRSLRACMLFALLLAVGLTVAQAQAPPYLVLTVDLETSDGLRGLVTLEGLNNARTSVGTFLDRSAAFLLRPAAPPTFVRCPGADVVYTALLDINNDGDTVGVCQTETEDVGFLRTQNGDMQELRLPGPTSSQAVALNDRREVVGTVEHLQTGAVDGWLWQRGRFTMLGFIPTAITNAREILGWRFDQASGRVLGLLRDRTGTLHDINFPLAFHTIPLDRNRHGDLVGFVQDATGAHPFVFTDGVGFRLFTLTQPGAFLVMLTGIADNGHLAGHFAVPWQHPTDPDIVRYHLGLLAIPHPRPETGIASRHEASLRMSLAAAPEETPTNTLTLQPSHVACARPVTVLAKVPGWQVCDGG